MQFILTSPHACLPNADRSKRVCDYAASMAADCLLHTLSASGASTLYFKGNELRARNDLNRKSSRGTPYRVTVAQAFASNPGSVVLDVHSFPAEYLDAAGDINFFRKGEVAPEIVLLQGPLDNLSSRGSIVALLQDALRAGGVRVKIIRGITVLDILIAGNEAGRPGVLLEFCESLEASPGRLREICEIIAETLTSHA